MRMGSPHFMRAMIGLSGARLALRLTPTFEEQCRIPGVPCALAEITEMNNKTMSKQILCFIIEGSSFSLFWSVAILPGSTTKQVPGFSEIIRDWSKLFA